MPDTLATNPVAIAHARLVVLGGDNQRLHEELIFAGGELREGGFTRIDRIGRLQELLAAATDVPAAEAVRERLKAKWENHRDNLERALDARMKERTTTLQSRLDDRAAGETSAMKAA
ncbi:hypothetical protein, partial [Bradyrhizobium sp. NBAIM08]|uniref:hypothetical protein n=1 Tax=Bradyrhizobium sp. NBAIM08 TaxID=2793815 RepID=UPI001CD64B7C